MRSFAALLASVATATCAASAFESHYADDYIPENEQALPAEAAAKQDEDV